MASCEEPRPLGPEGGRPGQQDGLRDLPDQAAGHKSRTQRIKQCTSVSKVDYSQTTFQTEAQRQRDPCRSLSVGATTDTAGVVRYDEQKPKYFCFKEFCLFRFIENFLKLLTKQAHLTPQWIKDHNVCF